MHTLGLLQTTPHHHVVEGNWYAVMVEAIRRYEDPEGEARGCLVNRYGPALMDTDIFIAITELAAQDLHNRNNDSDEDTNEDENDNPNLEQ